jgi:hypothetical protein
MVSELGPRLGKKVGDKVFAKNGVGVKGENYVQREIWQPDSHFMVIEELIKMQNCASKTQVNNSHVWLKANIYNTSEVNHKPGDNKSYVVGSHLMEYLVTVT